MLRIAICDDDPTFLTLTAAVIGRWENKPLDLQLETFENGDELIRVHDEVPLTSSF